jgi:RimJ/RimL family protein N-acetyltransferase
MLLSQIALSGYVIREAQRGEVAEIQAFNDANPEYWRLTHGHPPALDDAARAFDAHPPPDMSYSEDLWFIVREQASGAITGQIAVATNLMATGVYHLGFFIVATHCWGSGLAARLHGAYQHWAIERGARWLRLGVVEANRRARVFWERLGYEEVQCREGYARSASCDTGCTRWSSRCPARRSRITCGSCRGIVAEQRADYSELITAA